MQLAQLRAEHETNKLNAVGNDVEIDATPLASIGQSLDDLKMRIEVQTHTLALQNHANAVAGLNLNQPQQSAAVDLDAIQAHLENGGAHGQGDLDGQQQITAGQTSVVFRDFGSLTAAGGRV